MKYSINRFRYFFLLLFILILPFTIAISNITFGIFSVLTIISFFYFKDDFYVDKFLILILTFLLYLSIDGFFQGSYNANKTLWKFLPILLIGTTLMYSSKKLPLLKLKKISVFSSCIFILTCLIRTIIFYTENHFLPFANDAEIASILKIHRPYLGFYVLLNIILSYDLFNKSDQKKYKYIYSLIFLFLFAFIVLIAARLSIISFFIISFIYVIFYLDLNIYKKFTIGILPLFIVSSFIFYSPKIQERLNNNNLELMIDHEPRFVIWESVNNISRNEDFNTIFGYGNYQLIEDYLVLNYEQIIDKKEKRDYYIEERFNTHSQFFDYFLFGGFIAFFFFISICLISLWKTKRDFTSFAIVISFILFFSVENVFHRQLGCYLFILYYFIALKNNKNFIVSD